MSHSDECQNECALKYKYPQWLKIPPVRPCWGTEACSYAPTMEQSVGVER